MFQDSKLGDNSYWLKMETLVIFALPRQEAHIHTRLTEKGEVRCGGPNITLTGWCKYG
jgi:hypothetical protein